MLYRKQGKADAAELLEDYSIRAKNNKLDEDRRNVLRAILDSSGLDIPPSAMQSLHTSRGTPAGYGGGGGPTVYNSSSSNHSSMGVGLGFAAGAGDRGGGNNYEYNSVSILYLT